MQVFVQLLVGAVLLGNVMSKHEGSTWAVLVAGSNEWVNYRHQADVAHAYHLLRDNHIHSDRIIVMAYDDIAHNEENPYPGKIFNNPNKKDVYAGLKIDYKGDDVNVDNFYAILTGNKTLAKGGTGRVLESTSNDRVFVYFADHGAPGLVSLIYETMTAKHLNDALREAHGKKMYKQLLFYMEACESGSMFENILPDDINVYAMTAANNHESSWAAYCIDEQLGCLGDRFSVSWMEDSEVAAKCAIEESQSETIGHQFQLVKNETAAGEDGHGGSHVQRFGNLSIEMEPVSWFQGRLYDPYFNSGYRPPKKHPREPSWPVREIKTRMLKLRLEHENDAVKAKLIQEQLSKIEQDREDIKELFQLLTRLVAKKIEPKTPNVVKAKLLQRVPSTILYPDCHHEVVTNFNKKCYNLARTPEALEYAYLLINFCNHLKDPEPINFIINTVCG